MKISTVQQILGARVLTSPRGLDDEVLNACGADMMSDVLAYVKDQGLLLTGLNNPQVIRTAEMMDMLCVVFVRNKVPDEMTIKLATEKNIAVMTTSLRLFEACGLLYSNGLGVKK